MDAKEIFYTKGFIISIVNQKLAIVERMVENSNVSDRERIIMKNYLSELALLCINGLD